MSSIDVRRRTLLTTADAELQRATRAVLTAVATDALSIGAGGRLPTGTHYREQFHVGAGTVQSAIGLLISAGALDVASRGHLGRHIRSLEIDRLWHLGGLPPVRFALPPRGPVEVRVLAEVLAAECAKLGVPLQIKHHRGGPERERLVARGEADIAVVSSGAQDLGDDRGSTSTPRIRLADFSYYAQGRMLVLSAGAGVVDRPGTRVAIDYSSLDQARLTMAEFPESEGFTYVEVDFPRVPVAILEGRADAGIWHEMQTLIPPRAAGLAVTRLRRPDSLEILAHSSAAELVVTQQRPELRAVTEGLNLERLVEEQQRLLALPEDDPELLDMSWTV